ncbi:MarR family winged helix-turn-helix transcriptional regulator [Telmatospirillum siberiense]|uniref:MarR family transcriptional regulator n=1 Tax=Telmatospirillum siberiense TaxID=382514 RepID=A0A2N3PWC6_9PROT|nr:MarR family transcriptional regulator [Telmatospirillum siberiense]PKU24702.1 MarR family transcriptional regulator [Telmatospirillum siberiense]
MTDRAAVAADQWRKERPDIDPFPMELLGRLAEAALVIGRDRLNPLFARFHLQPGEFDVLATLRRSGEPCALTPTELYGVLMISSGGMTSRIDRLERAGLIERRRHPTDRRGTLVALTADGRRLIDELVVHHVENERSVLSCLSEVEQRDLDGLLAKLLAGLSGRSSRTDPGPG